MQHSILLLIRLFSPPSSFPKEGEEWQGIPGLPSPRGDAKNEGPGAAPNGTAFSWGKQLHAAVSLGSWCNFTNNLQWALLWPVHA